MNFQLLIETKMLQNKDFSCLQTIRRCVYMLINVKMPTIVGILTFNEHDKFHTQLSWAWKKFYNPELSYGEETVNIQSWVIKSKL